MWKNPHWKRDMRRVLGEQPRLAAALISAEDNSEINWKNQSCFQILSDDRMGILSLGECLFWLAPPASPPPRTLLVVGPHWILSLVSCLPSPQAPFAPSVSNLPGVTSLHRIAQPHAPGSVSFSLLSPPGSVLGDGPEASVETQTLSRVSQLP